MRAAASPLIYMDHGSTSHPKAPGVSQQVKEALDNGCFNINRGGYAGAWAMAEKVFDTREQLARLFGFGKSKNVIFTGSVTQSLNMVLKGLLGSGDHAVTTQMDHNAVLRPLHQLREEGVALDIAPCGPDGALLPEDLAARLRPNTKLVVMTHASNVCGALLPIREIGAICRERGIFFAVDAAQTAGVFPIDMDRDQIDILAFTGHKGLLGPQGIGGFLLREEAAAEMKPLLAGGTGSFSHLVEVPPLLPDKFEAGTLNLPGIMGLNAALAHLEQTGIEAVGAGVRQLMERFLAGLEGIPRARLVGPKGAAGRCPVIALDFVGLDNGEVAGRLEAEFGIMTRSGLHCAPLAHRALGTFPRGVVRFSLGQGNTVAEVDRALEGIREIAAKG